MRRSIVIALLLVLALSSAAAHARDSRNAFTWYTKAREHLARMPQERWNAVITYWQTLPDDPTLEPTPEVRATLQQLQPAFAWMKRGSRQEYNDSGLDYSMGLAMPMPHIGEMRRLTMLMLADTELKLREGNSAGAAEQLGTLYRMSGQMSDDGIIISSLVGQAIFAITDQGVQNTIDRGLLRPEDAQALIAAMKTLDATDPFEYGEAIASEQEWMIGWIEAALGAEEEREAIAEQMGSDAIVNENADKLAAMTPEQFDDDLNQFDTVIDRAVEAFMLDNPDQAGAEIKAIEDELESGEHGVLSKLLLPVYSKLLENKFRGRKEFAARIATLEGIARGEISPAELVNAALWYLRAIEMLRKLPPEAWALIRAAAENPAAPVDQSLSEAIAAAAPIIEVLREGSEKRRCDFRPTRLGPLSIMRPYVAGMRDLVRVVHADAVRCEHAGDLDGLTDRLAIAFRMSAHLSGDGALLSALTAHRIFSATADLTPLNPRLHQLSEPQRTTLLAAVDVMSRKDPFGYLEAAATDRKQVDAWLRPLMPGGVAGAAPIAPGQPGELDPASAASALTQSLQGDRLLFMLVLHDSLRVMPSAAAVDANAADASEQRFIESLDDMIDAETWRGTRQRGSELRRRMDEEPQWPAQAFTVITSLPTAVIAPLAEPMRAARGDLRRMALALQPPRGERKPSAEPAPALEPVATPP